MNNFERLKYYDFQTRDHIWKRNSSWQWVRVKLPAYDIYRAITLFTFMCDTPDFMNFPNESGNMYIKNGDASAIKFLFRQIEEFEIVKTSGRTIHQFRMTRLYNQHDFLPLFDDKYTLKV